MCGIIAVVPRLPGRAPPTPTEVLGHLDAALAALAALVEPDREPTEVAAGLAGAAERVGAAAALLSGVPGVTALLSHSGLSDDVVDRADQLDAKVAAVEAAVDSGAMTFDTGAQLEAFNSALTQFKDAAWALRRDRLRTASGVAGLVGDDPSQAALVVGHSIQVALSALDRLEVRGRDSAGLHVLVTGHGLDPNDSEISTAIADRGDDPLFRSGTVRLVGDGALSFVYKTAVEIGELGENGRALRRAVAGDRLLASALTHENAQATVLCHTRWASVGIVSEANAHPLDSTEIDAGRPLDPYVVAASNGDVDNHLALIEAADLALADPITTDGKVVPTMVARHLADGHALPDAFRAAVTTFDGSVAIAAQSAATPDAVLLGLRGSGQGLYVGLAEDAFVVTSEPYGLVEVTSRFVRLDGEGPQGKTGAPGQMIVLDRGGAGEPDGIRRWAYDGTELPVDGDEIVTAEVTTRDIDRGDFPHYLLKEINESPRSMAKTLRGRITSDSSGRLRADLGEDVLPKSVADALGAGQTRRVLVTGQGTAAVAGQAVASILRSLLTDTRLVVEALPATELSGFAMTDEMDDIVVVAISQSGTTADTNRTVDLVRSRGASVISIVNRRNSDLVEKSDGVLYTADGRDVEMAVPSTKAFYAQIGAGTLLAVRLAEAAGALDRQDGSDLLQGLTDLPKAMVELIGRRDVIAQAARLAPSRRYWAVVGNGLNRVAAEEIRIKLSELCYKSIGCDATEDKKHIDLAAEPLIVVCAAGLGEANAADVAKEVAIYRAHRATPIVIATDGEDRFEAASAVVPVPPVHPPLAFVLSALAGHLFGYEAALAIDAQAGPLRRARAAIDLALAADHPDQLLDALISELAEPAGLFADGLRAGEYDGHLEASTATRVSALFRYATGLFPLDAYEIESGRVGTPGVVVDDLNAALAEAIDQLTRPIDAIKHQAKTVTVGISRSEEELLTSPLVAAVFERGVGRDGLAYRALRTLAALGPAVAEVNGHTRYRIEGDVAAGATIHVVDKGGVAASLVSRTETQPELLGTKHHAARARQVTVARGARDGRTLVIVPETKGAEVTGLMLLHVRFHDQLSPAAARATLDGYQGRLDALVDAVTETEASFDDEVLATIEVAELLTAPVHVLASRWRTGAGS